MRKYIEKRKEKKKLIDPSLKAQNAAYLLAKRELIRLKIHFYNVHNIFIQREKEKKTLIHLHAREEHYTGQYLRHIY
jgi:hypothetical protein